MSTQTTQPARQNPRPAQGKTQLQKLKDEAHRIQWSKSDILKAVLGILWAIFAAFATCWAILSFHNAPKTGTRPFLIYCGWALFLSVYFIWYVPIRLWLVANKDDSSCCFIKKRTRGYKTLQVVLSIATTAFWTIGITQLTFNFLREKLAETYEVSSTVYLIFQVLALASGWAVCAAHWYVLVYAVGYKMLYKTLTEEDSERDRMVV